MTENGAKLPSIAIIGGGLTGLILAQGLQRHGYVVSVYEEETSIGSRGREWTMLIHWGLASLLSFLPDDILADLPSSYTDPAFPYEQMAPIPFYNGATGDIPVGTPAVSMRRISRTRMRILCSRGLTIHYGKAFSDLEVPPEMGPATIYFEDGSTASADLVIGADGSNSRVRRWLLGEEAGKAQPTDFAICSGIASYHDAEKAKFIRAAHPICIAAFNDTGTLMIAVQDVPDNEKPETWSFHMARIFRSQVAESLVGDEAIAKLKELSKNMCEPFHSATQWVPQGSQFFLGQLKYWVTVPWDNRAGRVTLAGDAAHSMTPSRGQGMNHALYDIDKLLGMFADLKGGKTSIQEGLKTYEEELVERGSKAVVGSLEDSEGNTKLDKEGLNGRVAKQGLTR